MLDILFSEGPEVPKLLLQAFFGPFSDTRLLEVAVLVVHVSIQYIALFRVSEMIAPDARFETRRDIRKLE